MPATPSAAEILARVAETYASARTYGDEGEQRTVTIHGPKPWDRRTTIKRVRTAFQRPDRFLIQCQEVGLGPESEWRGAVLWQDADGTHTWSPGLEHLLKHEFALSNPIGAIAGISGGLSTFIPKLLMPELPGNPTLPTLHAVELVNETELDGRACYQVRGSRADRQPASVIWIDCGSWLVLRLDESRAFDENARAAVQRVLHAEVAKLAPDDPKRRLLEQAQAARQTTPQRDFTTESTTRWHPHLNEPIDPQAFTFVPPA